MWDVLYRPDDYSCFWKSFLNVYIIFKYLNAGGGGGGEKEERIRLRYILIPLHKINKNEDLKKSRITKELFKVWPLWSESEDFFSDGSAFI